MLASGIERVHSNINNTKNTKGEENILKTRKNINKHM
jgi:hypothetical protein